MEDQKTVFSYLFQADTSNAKHQIKELNTATQTLSKSMISAFDKIIVKGSDVEDVFKSLALNLSKQAFKQTISPVQSSLSSTLGFDVSGIFGSLFGFAKGGAFTGGSGGGVLNSPMAFPMAGGNTGIAGEAGPEAILPLSRGPNGELGVRASGGSNSVTVNVNISTPDIESFRRSEGEIATTLQRIVSRGNRNL